MKRIILALGFAVAAQPAPAVAMEQVKAVASNKWVIAGTCALVGYGVQKYAGNYLKNNVFVERACDDSMSVAEIITNTKYNVNIGDLPDDTTANGLNFAADIADLKGTSALGAYALTNSFNFYRSVDTVVSGAQNWFKNLTPKAAALTGVYTVAGIATAIAPQMIAKDNVWAQASLRFISRSYLRSKFLQWVSNDEGHKFNKNLADVFDMGLTAYYKA